MTRRKSNRIPALIIHAIIFYAFWACWALLIRPAMKDAMHDSLLFEILASCIKLASWTLPALLLIRHFSPELQVGFRQMFTAKVPLKSALLWILLFSAYSGGNCLFALFKGNLHINPEFTLKSHIWLLVVGITEEAVFRGWMLNATAKKTNDMFALGLNALMFLAIHFPKWIDEGIFIQAFTGFGFLSVIIFSVVTGVIFLKTKNLVLPVLLHMWYDLMLSIF